MIKLELTTILFLIIFIALNKSYGENRKRVYENKKTVDRSKARGGRGNKSKHQGQKENNPKKRQEEKDTAIKKITPYKKSLSAGRKISEKASRESRIHATSRAKLLRLLKEKIDQKNMKRHKTHFTRNELNLLRKMELFKKFLDTEEEKIKQLDKQIELKDKELADIILKIREERIRITRLLDERQKEDERKINKLVKTLEGVKPVYIATFLENVDQDLSLVIIEKMKPAIFAKALEHMSKDKAIKLNEKFIAKEY